MDDKTSASTGAAAPEVPPPAPGSASVGRAQGVAACIWNAFKAEGLHYVDIIELCAVLLVNVADKSESTDREIIGLVRKVIEDMRKNAAHVPCPVCGDTGKVWNMPDDREETCKVCRPNTELTDGYRRTGPTNQPKIERR